MQELSKTAEKDMSIIAVEGWQGGGVVNWYEFFDFEFPMSVFYHSNGIFEFYRDLEAFSNELPEKLATWFSSNSEKIQKISTDISAGVDYFNSLNCTEETTVDELMEMMEKTFDLFGKGFIGVTCANYIPQLATIKENAFSIEIVKQMVAIRDGAGKDFFDLGVKTINNILGEIGKRKNWNVFLLKYIMIDELRRSLAGDTFRAEVLEHRKKDDFIFYDAMVWYENEMEQTLSVIGYKLDRNT